MIFDSITSFGDDVDIGVNASSAVEMTNVLQLDAVKRHLTNNASGNPITEASVLNDLGRADGVMLNIRVASEDVYAAASVATLQIDLYKNSSSSSIASGGSLVVQYVIQGIAVTGSQADHVRKGAYLVQAKLPKNVWGDTTNKYIGIVLTPKAQNLSSGKVTAWLGLADDDSVPGAS